MHELHEYLCSHLNSTLSKRRVVVVYDVDEQFKPFFERELQVVGTGHDGLPRVLVGEKLVFLARYDGSYYGLRAAVEPVMAEDEPDPLIVYVPGVGRDRETSVLMELELGGDRYEPQLKKLSRPLLRKKLTDGEIDELLSPAGLTYADVVDYLQQTAGEVSILHGVFPDLQNERLIEQWLMSAENDETIQERGGTSELFKLISTRLGLSLPADTTLAEARAKMLRYALVNEFRTDLSCAPPASAALVPEAPSALQLERVQGVAAGLRDHFPDEYPNIADSVEADMKLSGAGVDASCLGSVDTFRFEERVLLAHVASQLANKENEQALSIIDARRRSFWVDTDATRQAQWEVCRLVANLALKIEMVRGEVAKLNAGPKQWVTAYADTDGWAAVDSMQRELETLVFNLDEEVEAAQAIAIVLADHEKLLRLMAERFTECLTSAGWAIEGVLQQTGIYAELVEHSAGKTAYFLVDALRYEMGLDVARRLEAAENLRPRPAVAAIPTLTTVGMGALMPGAAASFSVVDEGGTLAARLSGGALAAQPDRNRFMAVAVPGVVDMQMDEVMRSSSKKLATKIANTSLVVVRSQDIDKLGEAGGDSLARQVMANVTANIARAVRKLAGAGVESFVITADHGHQFAVKKGDDMKTESPGGDTLELHRRCWIGRGGSTPPGAVRVTGAELGYDTDLDFVFPVGLGVFKSGGGLSYHHGGLSLQELVVPAISFRMPAPAEVTPHADVAEFTYLPDAITNRTFSVRLLVQANLLSEESMSLRIALLAGDEQVGEARVAIEAELDHASGVLALRPGQEGTVGMLLTDERCGAVKVVLQDPATDAAVLVSDEIPVKLGV